MNEHDQDRTRYGPAIRFFAEALGEDPDRLASDPRALTKIIEVLGREAVELLRRYSSSDPRERAEARRRWDELRERLERDTAADDAAASFRKRLNRTLKTAVDRLERLKREVVDERPNSVPTRDEAGRRGTEREGGVPKPEPG